MDVFAGTAEGSRALPQAVLRKSLSRQCRALDSRDHA